jgi:hypothetical protein
MPLSIYEVHLAHNSNFQVTICTPFDLSILMLSNTLSRSLSMLPLLQMFRLITINSQIMMACSQLNQPFLMPCFTLFLSLVLLLTFLSFRSAPRFLSFTLVFLYFHLTLQQATIYPHSYFLPSGPPLKCCQLSHFQNHI